MLEGEPDLYHFPAASLPLNGVHPAKTLLHTSNSEARSKHGQCCKL